MQSTIQLSERATGCLLAGAAGDALGAAVEFIDRDAILRRFGASGIRSYAPAYGGLGMITDDTQMTLFTAEGCLRAVSTQLAGGKTDMQESIREAYLRWLCTQDVTSDRPVDRRGWLFEQQALFSRRAPGSTCLGGLRRRGGENNHSKGCGGIMRVAPAGIFHAGDPAQAFELGATAARLTHGYPTGYLSAGVFAAIVAELMVGKGLPDAIASARSILLSMPDHAETLAALDSAVHRAEAGESPLSAIPALGEGWIAEEALAISVYCALVAESLEEGVILAINITGDSDSTGAITGNLLGALHGVMAIPARWLEPLELRDVIETVAHDLILVRNTDWQGLDIVFSGRYPVVIDEPLILNQTRLQPSALSSKNPTCVPESPPAKIHG
ncbi:MAG: ADP-ribosyl-[dinitrogen reductase] hydrolase [Bradyrhizobium sp.]|jgi:ADP-ribosyl-[dinitrogen reductase] hydrolase